MKAVLRSDDLGAALVNVLPHAGKDDTLPVLTCLEVIVADNTLTVRATDRYTLAWHAVTVEDGFDPGRFLLPAASAKEIARWCKPRRGEKGWVTVTLEADERSFTFAARDAALTDRVGYGTFPNTDTIQKLVDRDDEPTGLIHLGVGHLAKFTRLHSNAYRPVGHAPLAVRLGGPLKAVVVTCKAVEGFAAVIMPVRVDES